MGNSGGPSLSLAPDVKGSSGRQILSTLDFWQLALHTWAITAAGLGMKSLLAPIFHDTYATSYVESGYLAASSMALYTLVRCGLPLATRRLSLVPVFMSMLALSSVLYAVAPAVIHNLPVCWLLVLQTLTGASFAGQSI